MLNLFRTLSSKDIVYNTDMENIFNAFSGLESQRLSLGGLTITPATNSTTTFKLTNAAGTQQVAMSTTTGNVDIAGFTKLGDNAIKVKKLTGTTSDTEGGTTSVAHGLTGSKILGWTLKVVYATNSGDTVGDLTAGYIFQGAHDATNFNVTLDATSSENVLSKPFIALIFYEE